MQISDGRQLLELKDNKFLGSVPKLTNSRIEFKGKNNLLVCEDNVHLLNSVINFNLDNSILYLSSNKHEYRVYIALNKDSACFIGKDNYFNGQTTIVLSETKNVVIGGDCMFSYDVIIRVSDAHAIYDTTTKKRVNFAKSIFIGDHVWLGQNARIFKGSKIGSGSIIGADTVVSNKKVPSNTTFVGLPARLAKKNTFWTPNSVHNWGREEIEEMSQSNIDSYTFEQDKSTFDLDKIEYGLNSDFIDGKHEFIKNYLLSNDKNRFFIEDSSQESLSHRKLSSFFK